jgi:hypothetical protein
MSTKPAAPAPATPEPAPAAPPIGFVEPKFKLGERVLSRADYDAEFAKIQAAARVGKPEAPATK